MNRTPRAALTTLNTLAAPAALALSAAVPAFGQISGNPGPYAPIPTADRLVVPLLTVATPPRSANPGDGLAPARLNALSASPDGRTFAVDQRGPVYTVLPQGGVSQYLDVRNFGLNFKNDNGEQGFSGVAFHPNFAGNPALPGYGKVYASFSANRDTTGQPFFATSNPGRDHDEVVYEFTTATPSAPTFTPSAAPRQVLRLAQPAGNHNGGGIGFNPNAVAGTPDYGALYYSSGDGGGGGDPFGQGQNAATPFSSILRIDPLGSNGATGDHGIIAANAFASDGNPNTLAENYAIGFRNPQRFSWDPGGTGKLFVGDVGQGSIEEVDSVVNGGNYGWSVREGSYTYVNGNTVAVPANPNDPRYINPVAEYDHSEGIAVSGGVVYRGTAVPELDGQYIFGDLANGRVFYIDADGAVAVTDPAQGQSGIRELLFSLDGSSTPMTLQQIVANGRVDLRFGLGADGTVYVLDKTDGVIRAIPVPEPTSAAVLLGGGLMLLRRRRRA